MRPGFLHGWVVVGATDRFGAKRTLIALLTLQAILVFLSLFARDAASACASTSARR